jgi:hypothetical protein
MECQESALRRRLTTHLCRYPQMAVQDLYKLIFQAAMAAEHGIADVAAARRRLTHELQELADGPDEPLIDPISPDGGIVRIHLRPYLASQGDPEALLAAFMRTAQTHHGSVATLQRYWHVAEDMAAAGLLPFGPEALRRFFMVMQAQGFPAVHHSAGYRAAYRPAYRVIVRAFLTDR